MAARKQPAQSPGERMVSEILAEMTEAGVQPDAKEVALLATARQLVDHLDALEQVIAKDGALLTSRTGVLRVHPAVVEHRQLAATVPRVLAAIIVGDSTAGGAGKHPAKVRAARARWDRRDQLRETQARRQAGA
jgi:hypothetical protein